MNSLFIQKFITPLDNRSSVEHITLLWFVVFIGFLLRLHSLTSGEGYHSFAINDEILAFKVAIDFLELKGTSWYLGPSMFSSGNAPGPLWVLFVASIYKVGFDTIWGAQFVMVIISTITIYLVYRLATHFMSPGYTIFTTILYATAPWVIYYSVGLYNPMPVAFLGVLLFLALINTIKLDNAKSVFWVCVISAALPQFHMITIFYYPAILIVLLLSKYKLNKSYLILGILTGFLLYLPYIVGDFANNWNNTKMIISGEDKTFSLSVLKVITAPVSVLANTPADWVGRDINPIEGYQSLGNRYFGSYFILATVNIIVLLLSFYLIFRFFASTLKTIKSSFTSKKSAFNENLPLLFTGLLVFIPLITFTLTGRNFATRYAILAFPLLFLIPGITAENFSKYKPKKILVTSYLLISIFNIYLIVAFYNYQAILFESSKHFLPSFVRLVSIRDKLNIDVNSQERIQVTLSNEIKKLPEGQLKQYRTVEEFLNPNPVQLDKKSSLDASRTILIRRSTESAQDEHDREVVYRSSSILILE